jgi:predicted transcriptional regulator
MHTLGRALGLDSGRLGPYPGCMNAKAQAEQPAKKLRELERRWTSPLMATGWTVLPNVLLDRQRALGLSSTDVNILLHIARHWWDADKLPYPSKKKMAECIGVTPSAVQRRIAKLERSGFIKRETRTRPDGSQTSNAYSLTGLIEAATPYAKEAIEKREQQRAEAVERRTRRQPQLKLLKTSKEEG